MIKKKLNISNVHKIKTKKDRSLKSEMEITRAVGNMLPQECTSSGQSLKQEGSTAIGIHPAPNTPLSSILAIGGQEFNE